MIMPPFSALLAHATSQMFGYRSPSLWSVLLNQLQHPPVFVFSPWSFYQSNFLGFLRDFLKSESIQSQYYTLNGFLNFEF